MIDRKLTNWLHSYMDYTDNSEPPKIFNVWVGLSTIAAALRRKCYLQWEKEIFPNMYVVLTAPSGKCRKGTAMGSAGSLLRDLGIQMSAESITREALIRLMQECTDNTIDPKTQKPMHHSSLTIFSKELTVFIGYDNKQLLSDLTDWFDCDIEWKYVTKNAGKDFIHGVWVNLIGATTPELLQKTLPPEAISGGLTSRIIFVYADKKSKLVPLPQLTIKDRELYTDLLVDLEKISMLTGEFIPTPDFLTRWVEWYTMHEKQNDRGVGLFGDSRFAGYCERRGTHLRKMCMLLSAARDDVLEITADDFDVALDLLLRTEKNMVKAFKGVGRSVVADIASDVVTTIKTRKEIPFSELLMIYQHDLTANTLDREIIDSLCQMYFCERVVTTDGQQKIVYTPEKYKARSGGTT